MTIIGRKQMNIIIDVVALDRDGRAGGVTWFTTELINGLAAHNNIRIIALCTHKNLEFLKEHLSKNVVFECIDNECKRNLITHRLAKKIENNIYVNKLVKKYQTDIFFCPFGVINYKVRKTNVVSVILDVQHEFYPEFFAKKELIARKLIYKYIAHTAKRVVCISEYTKDTFCERYKYDRAHADVIYIAVQERFEDCDERILNKLSLDKNQYVLYPANCWAHKNHERLLHAFEKSADNNSLKLVLTGNMFGKEEQLMSCVSEEGVRKRTVVAGYVDEAEMCALLKNCRGLIFPSMFEGFGIPVVEAMQHYKPIACSNTTSLPEIGCSSIFYFNPKDENEIEKGLEYIAKTNVTEKMKKDYDNSLTRYNGQEMTESYIKLFQDLLRR